MQLGSAGLQKDLRVKSVGKRWKEKRQWHKCTFVVFMLFCSSHFKVTEVIKAGRRAERIWKEWFKKELRECNEQSPVDNNEPDEVQMLIKCFESLGCFASIGT